MKRYTVTPRCPHAQRLAIGDESPESVFLGRLAEAGPMVDVHLDTHFPHVVALFGKRGSGKSYALGSIIEGLCAVHPESTIGSRTTGQAVVLFDTLGIFQWMDIPLESDSDQALVREQWATRRGWNIETEPLSVTIWSPPGQSRLTGQTNTYTVDCADFTASDWAYLLGLDVLQDRMGQLLGDAHQKVTEEGWSDGSRDHAPTPRYALEDLIACVDGDVDLTSTYHPETRRAVRQQLGVYARSLLFQPKRNRSGELLNTATGSQDEPAGTPLTTLLRRNHASIVQLQRLTSEERYVVITSLMRRVMLQRMQTAEAEKSLRVVSGIEPGDRERIQAMADTGIPSSWVVVDEAQNFLPAGGTAAASDTLVRLVREGRNYGLSFMFTTQQPTAIDQRVLAQVDTLITHKLTVQGDIEQVRRNLKSAMPATVKHANATLALDALLRTLDTGQALISNTEADRAYVLDMRPRVSVHGGFGA